MEHTTSDLAPTVPEDWEHLIGWIQGVKWNNPDNFRTDLKTWQATNWDEEARDEEKHNVRSCLKLFKCPCGHLPRRQIEVRGLPKKHATSHQRGILMVHLAEVKIKTGFET